MEGFVYILLGLFGIITLFYLVKSDIREVKSNFEYAKYKQIEEKRKAVEHQEKMNRLKKAGEYQEKKLREDSERSSRLEREAEGVSTELEKAKIELGLLIDENPNLATESKAVAWIEKQVSKKLTQYKEKLLHSLDSEISSKLSEIEEEIAAALSQKHEIKDEISQYKAAVQRLKEES